MEMEGRRRGVGERNRMMHEQNVREAKAKPLLSNGVASGNTPQDLDMRGSTHTQRSMVTGIYDSIRERL